MSDILVKDWQLPASCSECEIAIEDGFDTLCPFNGESVTDDDYSLLKERHWLCPCSEINVTHGRWTGNELISSYAVKKCSACGQLSPIGYYCYNCGASMTGARNHD